MSADLPFKLTRTWKTTLAVQDGDPLEPRRAELRIAFEALRSRALELASSISSDLPDFTMHDHTHIDALWEMADLLIPENVFLTPTEGFVLGAAFCTHDLGLTLRAYDGGLKEIEEDSGFQRLLVDTKNRLTRGQLQSGTDANIAAKKQAVAAFLRQNHADKAKNLCTQSWRLGSDSQFLIETTIFRESFGHLIGQLAHSHWLSLEDVSSSIPELVPSPGVFPPDWSIRALYLAALLRCADAIHLDHRRSPTFSRCLHKPQGVSDQHWQFQNKLLRPSLRGSFIELSANSPFTYEQAQAWWLCFETASTASFELQQSEFLLTPKPDYPSMKARGILGVDSPKHFSGYVKCQDWEPVDASARVSDIAHIITTLGGEALYGPGSLAPFREVAANAFDATRSLATNMPSISPSPPILLDFVSDANGMQITVTDRGIGMPRIVLSEVLLDFGKSHWKEELGVAPVAGGSARTEITGRYGLGFFSVFSWCETIEVKSRYWKSSIDDTWVLTITPSTSDRPLLRRAKKSEWLLQHGTEIKLKLTGDAEASLRQQFYGKSIDELVRQTRTMLYCTDVPVFLSDYARSRSEMPILTSDHWKEVDPTQFLMELCFDGETVEPEVFSRVSQLARNVRPVMNESGNMVGRCAFYPERFFFQDMPITKDKNGIRQPQWFPMVHTGKVYVGGLYAQNINHLAGILLGNPARASRDEALPLASQDDLARWALEQSNLLLELDLNPDALVEAGSTLVALCREPGSLPICRTSTGYLNTEEVVSAWSGGEVIFLQDAAFSLLTRDFPGIKLLDSVHVISMGVPGFLTDNFSRFERRSWWPQGSIKGRLVLTHLMRSFAGYRGLSLDLLGTILEEASADQDVERVIGVCDGKEIISSVDVLHLEQL